MAVDTSNPVLRTVGNYDLVEKIAEGGMGSVYRAKNRTTGDTVAIKVVSPHMATNPVLLKRFEQEFRAASSLDHPNIVRALDFGTAGPSPFLVMEFVEGESLGSKIERDGKLSELDSIRIIAQIAMGLRKAHKLGLIHRDVKPDNILVTQDGTAKLADMGLVKELETDLNLTRTGRGLGTPHFMAPEQFRNAKNADARCDIYSLAATLYMMVTGELPFKSCGPLDAWMKKVQNELTPPRVVNPALSERVDWAIRRGMHSDPEQRPATCREFIEDLTGRSTRKQNASVNNVPGQDLWFLVYHDEQGEVHTVKGTPAAIRRSLKEGLLGDASNVRASRIKTGPFEPLREYPEFRDLVLNTTPLPGSTPAPSLPARGPAPETIPTAMPYFGPNPGATPIVPHIPLEGSHRSPLEWLMWPLLVLLAVGTALAGVFLFRH